MCIMDYYCCFADFVFNIDLFYLLLNHNISSFSDISLSTAASSSISSLLLLSNECSDIYTTLIGIYIKLKDMSSLSQFVGVYDEDVTSSMSLAPILARLGISQKKIEATLAARTTLTIALEDQNKLLMTVCFMFIEFIVFPCNS